MVDAHSTGRACKRSAKSFIAETVKKVFRIDVVATNTEERVLEATILDLAIPEGGLTDLGWASGSLIKKDVAGFEPIDDRLVVCEVHLLDIVKSQPFPVDVSCTEVRAHLRTRVILGRPLAPEPYLGDVTERCLDPSWRQLPHALSSLSSSSIKLPE